MTLSWHKCSFIILKILWPLKIMWNQLCLCNINGIVKSEWQHICLQHGLLNIFKPIVDTYLMRGKKKSFLSKCYWSLTMHLVTQELWWRWTRLMLFFCLLLQRPLCSLWMDQGIISTLKSYYLRNTFCKAVGRILERIHHSRCHWNIVYSWREVQLLTLTGIWKKLIPTFEDNLEALRISVEE